MRSLLLLFLFTSLASAFASDEPDYRRVYSGLHLTGYCTSLLARGLGLSSLPEVSWSEVNDRILAPPATGTKKLEIGAGTRPICPDCVQVDMYESSFQMDKSNAEFWLRTWKYKPGDRLPRGVALSTGGFLTDQERLQRLSRLTCVSEAELLEPFAVVTAKEGIVCNARQIPLPAQSASLVVVKNFPWFERVSLMNRTPAGHPWYGRILSSIQDYLTEYDRLLAPGGQIVILASAQRDTFRLMWNHIQLAQRMGYKVSILAKSEEVSGIVLTKPVHVDDDLKTLNR